MNNNQNCSPQGAAGGSTNNNSSTTIQISKSDLNLDNAPCNVDGTTVGNLLGIAYFAAGVVAVIVMIVAGIRYATANGDSNQIQSAKNTMFYAIVGLVVVIIAAAATQFILTQLTQ